MTFIAICTALYDYHPQGDNELAIQEGELIYVLEKSTEDDWWKAKKRAPGEDEEEPIGLIPNNYVQEAPPTHHAKALYDYSRQTDEEVSFSEDARLDVFDTSDPDWTLVGFGGEYGFAPANYIEITGDVAVQSPDVTTSPQDPDRGTAAEQLPTPTSPASPVLISTGPAAALAGVMHTKPSAQSPTIPTPVDSPPPNLSLPPRRPQYTPEDSDEDEPVPPAPSLPQRPPSEQMSPPVKQYASPRSPETQGVMLSPPYNRVVSQGRNDEESQRSPGGFHLYNVNEMVSAIGKKKKLPTTLGLNLATGTIMIAPEKSRDGPQQEWTAEKLTHYSIEGKHVFMELIRPSKSVDLHAGAKDTAQEIVAGLGEIAGAARAEGLREILEISEGGGGQKKGKVLYDFMAQGDDEVTVAVDDEVIIIDDKKSEEWWMVRRLKNGKEGVVPSSYVEAIGKTAPIQASSGLNAGKSVVDQNRLEEENMAKEAVKSTRKRGGSDSKSSEVGPGLKLPARGSSLTSGNDGNTSSSQRSKRDSKAEKSSSKTIPDKKKTRTWTDRSGSFKVEAQFIGLKDGKIHLHKLNGVKIAVPVVKMAIEDLEYVEKVTGQSLDDDKPLSEIRRRGTQMTKDGAKKPPAGSSQGSKASAAVQKPGVSVDTSKKDQNQSKEPKGPEYDWFEFFLKTGVNPYQCERYAFNFNKDSMDETILPEIDASVLRTLGLKEGDILRVMKYLDSKFNRNKSKLRNVSNSGEMDDGDAPLSPTDGGGLFSGPGGALRNNTRKGRPAPPVQSSDVVDAESLKQKSSEKKEATPSDTAFTPLATAPPPPRKNSTAFDDDAWNVKPSKQPTRSGQQAQPEPSEQPAKAPPPTLTGAMAELSLLTPPLQPTIVSKPIQQQNQAPQPSQPADQQQASQLPQQTPQAQLPAALPSQPTGANPSFFSQLGQQQPGAQTQQQPILQAAQTPTYGSQPSFQNQHQPMQSMPPRQRPQAPQAPAQQQSFIPPPPRPLSAPQNASQSSNFGPPPLQPQLTGFQPSNNLPQLAPPGQSLNDMNQMTQQQMNQQQMYPQQTGFPQQSPSFSHFSGGIVPQQTGYVSQFQSPQQPSFSNQQQPFISGQQTGSPFADPRPHQQIGGFPSLIPQPTGFQPQYANSLQTQQTSSINSFLPPALQPQNTGANGFGSRPGFGQTPPVPPMPPMPAQPTAAPLIPQKTGPAPPVRFGTQPIKKLTPQPTGRKANLSQATPQNPFGF